MSRERLGLADGFEGNAQSFRIVTTIDLHGPSGTGLDLTAAVRAAVLKYPWTRRGYPDPHPSDALLPPRGGGPLPGAPAAGSAKFSAYSTELDDLVDCRAAFPVGPWQQTVEAAVMDTADDIAYAIHDLEDFHRVGVLQQAGVATELSGWRKGAGPSGPGSDLERLRRRLRDKDAWAYDDDAFRAAVARVRDDLVDGLLAVPFDGSMAGERAVAEFSARWTSRLAAGVTRASAIRRCARRMSPWPPRSGTRWSCSSSCTSASCCAAPTSPPTSADRRACSPRWWRRSPRGSPRTATVRASRRACTTWSSSRGPSWRSTALASGRAVIDYVASLTDGQATALLDVLTGRSTRLWTDAPVL